MLCRYFDDANGRFGGAAWLQARHCHTTFGEQLLVPVIVRRSLPYRTTLFGAFTSGMHHITHSTVLRPRALGTSGSSVVPSFMQRPKKMFAGMKARKHRSLSPNRHFVQFHECIMHLRDVAPIIAFRWKMHYHQRAYPSADIIVLVEMAATTQQVAAVMNALGGDIFDDIDNISVIVTSSRDAFDAMVCD
jgi:hypothetical protein